MPECMQSMFLQTFAATNYVARSALKLADQTFGFFAGYKIYLPMLHFGQFGLQTSVVALVSNLDGSNYWILPT